jgi:hypothetical protein
MRLRACQARVDALRRRVRERGGRLGRGVRRVRARAPAADGAVLRAGRQPLLRRAWQHDAPLTTRFAPRGRAGCVVCACNVLSWRSHHLSYCAVHTAARPSSSLTCGCPPVSAPAQLVIPRCEQTAAAHSGGTSVSCALGAGRVRGQRRRLRGAPARTPVALRRSPATRCASAAQPRVLAAAPRSSLVPLL